MFGVTHVSRNDGTYGRDTGVSALRKRLVYLPVSCGKCENCRKKRNLEWSNRLLMEYYYQKENTKGFKLAFLTLTFNDSNYAKALECRDMLLDKHGRACGFDYTPIYRNYLQPYFKRLRAERGENLEFSYYCVSEFGEQRGRFHFHLLLYFRNLDVHADEIKAWVKTHPLHRCYRKDSKGAMRPMTDLEVYLRDKLLRQWVDDTHRHDKMDSRFIIQYHSDTLGHKSVHCAGEYGHIDLVCPDNAGMIRYVTGYTNKCIKDGTSTFNRQSCGIAREFGKMIATDIFYETKHQICIDIDGKENTFGIPKYFIRKFGNPVTRTARFWNNLEQYQNDFVMTWYPSCKNIDEVVYIREQERKQKLQASADSLNEVAGMLREDFDKTISSYEFEKAYTNYQYSKL